MQSDLDDSERQVIAILRADPNIGFSYTADDGNQHLYDAARSLVKKGLARSVRERGTAMVSRVPKIDNPYLAQLMTRRVQILGFIRIELYPDSE